MFDYPCLFPICHEGEIPLKLYFQNTRRSRQAASLVRCSLYEICEICVKIKYLREKSLLDIDY